MSEVHFREETSAKEILMKPQHSTVPDSPDQLFDLDSLLDDEEKAVRSTVRQSVGERVKPYVADSYQTGQLPARELARQFGELGMHLEGYGCADDWVLSGTKMWITNGSIADVAIVWARTDDGIRGFYANNLESVLTYEGTSEMHALVIGQALTGQQAFR
jgi:alkylation response protein AidB-like acyl-CoA dehydrogenase